MCSSDLARLALPAGTEQGHPEFALHPALIDGGLQLAAALAGSFGTRTLPFSVEEVSINAALPEECFTYAVRLPELSPALRSYDIHLLDDSGKQLVTMWNFVIKTARNGAEAASSSSLETVLDELKAGEISEDDATLILETILD